MNIVKKFLENKAYQMRISSLLMTSMAGSGHPTSSLSAADLVAALFFYAMRYDPNNPNNPNNDRFILSKGHASPILYAVYKELGLLSQDEILTYRNFDSVLEGHPTMRFKYTQAATGSLGIGLSIGAGMSKAAKMDDLDFYTYVLMGDSEITEGSVWEAAEIAAYYKLNNLIAIVDCNRLGQTTETIHGYHTQRYADKFEAFGWKAFVVDGHNMQQIMSALDKAHEVKDHPTVIIAKTVKGYGAQVAENKEGFHGKAFKKEELNEIFQSMEERFAQAVNFNADSFDWQPSLPPELEKQLPTCDSPVIMDTPAYDNSKDVATRKAYGQALRDLGGVCKTVVSLDAEVKNSTFAEIFEKKYPDRFVQCFIAEQNMVGMGIGMDHVGKMPYLSTFASFFTRAHDQIRMAAIGSSTIKLVGSHVGVSIGQDGPSQMGLEDIAMMRALPNSIVLYPSDAVSTHWLVNSMANYNFGISYMRTTRMATPIIYDNNETFEIGSCKVLRSSDTDKVCVIGAGITLHEALKAYDELQTQNINIAVIDLYSIKPLDAKTIIEVAQKAGKKIITVEDHYLQGGLGEAVTYAMRNKDMHIDCLAVKQLPRSGKPEELLGWAGIDAAAIIQQVKKLF